MTFHLTVIAKEPVAGRVKTRLVPPLSHEQAARIAAACLADTFAAGAAVVARHTDVRPVALIDGAAGDWIPPDWAVHHQRGDGLGARLANGFADLGPGLIVGMDTPSAGRWFDDALAALRVGSDAIGMTVDGGYWGIALTEPAVDVFAGVPMSTATTGAVQLDRLRALGREVVELPTVRDLDRFDDLAPLVAELPGSALAGVAAQLVAPWG